MKKIVLALCMCAVFCTAGCGNSQPESSSEVKSTTTSAETSAAETTTAQTTISAENENEEYQEITDNSSGDEEADLITVNPKYDPEVVNEGVENAVKENSPEEMYVNGYYGFSTDGFNKVYSNEELQKCFDRLNEICNNSNFNFAFSYQNMDTGATVDYNQYTKFMTCSTIKAPYVKSILMQDINLDEIISRDFIWPYDTEDGDIVANMPQGTKLTTKQLIEYAIEDSDNTAYYLLFKRYGYSQFNNTLYSIGANYSLGDSWIFTYSTSLDMRKSFADIYEFAKDNKQGQWLIDLMSDTSVNIQIGKALGSKYTVAQKYGSEFNENVFNDCAIVYADSPFVLCVMSDQRPETEESCKVFKELAVVFDDINSLIAQ